jgi:hypothetical protein
LQPFYLVGGWSRGDQDGWVNFFAIYPDGVVQQTHRAANTIGVDFIAVIFQFVQIQPAFKRRIAVVSLTLDLSLFGGLSAI